MQLKNKRILLTGATGGIGKHIARLLARKGANLALVGRDKGAQRSSINLSIHMGDQFEDDVVNARKAGGRAVHQTGQFPAVASGQMPSGHLYLLFDEVKVIEKPFGGRRDALVWVFGKGRTMEGS